MDNRNYSVEQWLSGLLNDRRFYPASSVRKYLEEQLDNKFEPFTIYGLCIQAPDGYKVGICDDEITVCVTIYTKQMQDVYKTEWRTRINYERQNGNNSEYKKG